MVRIIKSSIRVLREEGFGSLLSKFLHYVRVYGNRAIYYPGVFFGVKKLKSSNYNRALNFVYSRKTDLIKPTQVFSEISGLLEVLDKIKPKKIVEIGIGEGGNLFLFTKIAAKDAEIIGLDWRKRGLLWRMPLYRGFAGNQQKIKLLNGDSHKYETLKKIEKMLNGKKIDFLFIDGDHTYEGVKKDFEMYNHLVKSGGLIAFHDIIPFTIKSFPCEVNKFWDEVKKKYKYKEIIDKNNNGWGGIGIITQK